MPPIQEPGLSADERIVHEAKERFRRAEEWEQTARLNYAADTRFAYGDETNNYQWPEDIVNSRASENKPCLTVNKTMQHCLHIINDQRQNKSQIKFRPTGGGASYAAAAIFEGITRHIEYQSMAQTAYTHACLSQVLGGIGYWRVTTDYAAPDSFDQEIFIRRVPDALAVFIDPDIMEQDGSDARFAFVFNDMPREVFDREHPRFDAESAAPLGIDQSDAWDTKDHVRVCEYFRKVVRRDRLHELDSGHTVRESEVKDASKLAPIKALLGLPDDADFMDTLRQHSVRSREVELPQIEWFLLAGNRIVERNIWPGKYIPIVRVIGQETNIDKRLDRFGHVRALLGPQRIYNYWTSAAVESVALQTKTPYLTAIESIDGFEENWAKANVENKAYLPYRSIDEDGHQINKPERAPPPTMSQAYIEGLKISAAEMGMVSGQYESEFGAKSNEVSGKAVDARERQGEVSTYHFIDNFAVAIRFTGRILADLIPLIYDTPRIVKILAIDGGQSTVQIDPNHPQAHSATQNDDDPTYDPENIVAIFNPAVGTYDIEADTGPEYGTRRRETFTAISQILQSQGGQSLVPIIGDLMFKAADFPLSQQIAERLHNMVPDKALGKPVPDPQVQELQQQLAMQHQMLLKQEQELRDARSKHVSVEQQKMIDQYNAETNRMKAVGSIDPEALKPIIRELVSQALATPIMPIIAAHKEQEATWTPPTPPQPS
jgi:hypothetical protein